MKNIKSITLLILVLIFLIGFVKGFFAFKEQQPLNPTEAEHSEEINHHHHEASHQAMALASGQVESKKKKKDELKEQSSQAIDFASRDEVKEILAHALDYPRSKKALMDVILQKDLYEAAQLEVKPHSLDEIKQRQQGALKIIALRVIVENENNKQTLLNDLSRLISQLSDPTLKAITQAVYDSAQKDRPFFEDFPNAVSRLEF